MSSQARLSALPTYQSTSSSRLKSLYSDFLRQKHSNPTSYASNVEWWRRTLEAVVLRGWQSSSSTDSLTSDRLILHASGPTFSEEFRFEGVGKPLSLAGVIAELCEEKAYFPLQQFLNGTQSIYDPGWLPLRIASFLVGKPLWWALEQLNIVNPEEHVGGHASDTERWRKVKGDYVVLSLLEKAADAVLQRQQSKAGLSLADSLYKFDGFKTEFAGIALPGVTLSDTDMRVLLKHLERDKKAVIVRGEAIKFVEQADSSELDVSAVDTGVLELKTGVENLQAQVDNIQRQIEDTTEKTSFALRRKQKEVALSYLRSRKLLQDILKKRLSSLETLHAALIRVEQAAGDVEIMKSYESSTATLRAILSHPSLQREKIEETMDAMSSAQADFKEIDEAIQLGNTMAEAESGIDDAELQAELDGLVKAVEKEQAEEKERAQAAEAKRVSEKLASGELKVPTHLSRASEEDSWTDQEMDEEFQKAKVEANPVPVK
ncbi:hypothetical protein C8Q75DRAFT_740149 [Abortiporus biennis]|nr:hypothetical protein C8Q75DRAFT_740149 [Abortiporus biennis]